MVSLSLWDPVELVATWLFYYFFIHVLYYGVGGAINKVHNRLWPGSPMHNQTTTLVQEQMHLSEMAFPIYCVVPAVGEWCRRKQFSAVCATVSECGGWGKSTLNFAVYLLLVEGMVFWIHYWVLHVWPLGKEKFKHSVHHSYKCESEMSAWTGYAFEAIDGASQGLPFVLFQFLIPIPYIYMIISGAGVGIWTLYIHIGGPGLPWPFMGADYHQLHHMYNWYNFGLFTRFYDWLFGTLRAPRSKQPHVKSAELIRGADW